MLDLHQSKLYSRFGEIIHLIVRSNNSGLLHHLLDERHRQNPEQR